MQLLEYFSALIAMRAENAWVALVAAMALGWLVQRLLPLGWTLRRSHALARALGRKLNRPRRDVATRAWRGVIALFMLLIPAIVFGFLLDRILPAALLFMIFSAALQERQMAMLWRQARQKTPVLQYPGLPHRFADSHAVWRYAIADHAARFTLGVAGATFWYLLAGGAGALGYLALALAAAHYTPRREENRAFGGVAAALFTAAHALPCRLALLLWFLAALFVPGTAPRRALRHGLAPSRGLADLLDVALGGAMPGLHGVQSVPWVGDGTPKLTATHLNRWGMLWFISLILLIIFVFPA